MGSPIVHFEVIGKDGAKLRKFYSDLFDWKMQVIEQMNYGLVNAQGDKSIGGGIGQTEDGGNGYVTVYAAVDDPQTYLDKAVSLGAKVFVPVTVIPEMVTFALFSDPEGHVFGLVKNEPK